MTLYQALTVIGLPSIVGTIVAYLVKRINDNDKRTTAVQLGIQALLRDRLYDLYNSCSMKGGATQSQRDNFINMYTQYHMLGQNGVMDNTKDRFLQLPIIP